MAGFWDWFTGGGTTTKDAVEGALNGLGDTAIKLRTAITGDLPPDKKAELQSRLADIDRQIDQAKTSVIIAEAQGASWLQRNWRPLLMLVIIIIIANNYVVFPYASIWTDKVKVLSLPTELWNVMMIGVGGYIAGRTIEKVKGAD